MIVFVFIKFHNKKGTSLIKELEKEIFVGYNFITKEYKIYNLKTNKIVVSRDVQSNEMTVWNWENLEDVQTKVLNDEPNQL